MPFSNNTDCIPHVSVIDLGMTRNLPHVNEIGPGSEVWKVIEP